MLVTGANQTLHGKQTGIWLEEFAIPYQLFVDTGCNVTVVSPKGGQAPLDPGSEQVESKAQWQEAIQKLAATKKIGSVSAKDFDAIFLPGGHGTMFDLPNNRDVQQLLSDFAQQDKVIAAVCHGPAGFVGVKTEDGNPLVVGKTITSFTDAEESAAGMVEEVPFLLESQLRKEGANFIGSENWTDHIEVDGRLVTGQNPASSKSTAEAVIKLLQ